LINITEDLTTLATSVPFHRKRG